MSLTSLSYFICALTWLVHDQEQLAKLFVLVSCASILADGVRMDSNVVRSVDRILGVTAFVWSIWLNLKCFRSVCVTISFTILAISFLIIARDYLLNNTEDENDEASLKGGHQKKTKKRKANYWGYLARHGLLWHTGGSLLLVFVTLYSHNSWSKVADFVSVILPSS